MVEAGQVDVLLQLKDEMSKALDKAQRQLGGFDKEAKKSQKTVDEFGNSISVAKGALLGFVGAAATRQVASFGKELFDLGLEADKIGGAFRNLADDFSGDYLNALQEASAGTISNLELMRSANQALLLGIEKEDLPRLIEVSRTLGKATGRTAQEAFGDITTGIGRQSKPILDNLGIIVDAEKAYEKYAASVGRATAALTDQERAQAFANEAMTQAEAKASQVGESTGSMADAAARVTTQFENIKLAIGEGVATGVFDSFNKFLVDAQGNARETEDSLKKLSLSVRSVIENVLTPGGLGGLNFARLGKITNENVLEQEQQQKKLAELNETNQAKQEELSISEQTALKVKEEEESYRRITDTANKIIGLESEKLRLQTEGSIPAVDEIYNINKELESITTTLNDIEQEKLDIMLQQLRTKQKIAEIDGYETGRRSSRSFSSNPTPASSKYDGRNIQTFKGIRATDNRPTGAFVGAAANFIEGRYADGGIVTRPTRALIGEQGPEAVVPLRGMNKGLGGNVTININAPMLSPDVMRIIKDEIVRDVEQRIAFGGLS